jgi:RNA polymerase sigma factor (sigma-70 family)
MDSALDALIRTQSGHGDAPVDHAEVATQLAALHAQSYGWAIACCGRRREDAEDVLHDVYVAVLENAVRFDGRSTFKTWIFGVIARTARARMRRDRWRALLGARHASRVDGPAAAPSPDDEVIARDRRARMLHALAQLPTRQREALQLVFYHCLTIDEAARVMRISVGSARVHYHRGKQRLASLFLEDQP